MPYYRHDCFNPHCCRYVGSDVDTKIDVYAYTDMVKKPSMIIRKSDDGPNYLCMQVEFYRDLVADPKVQATHTQHIEEVEIALKLYDKFFTADS
jgi:hypothetical protein